MASLMDFYQPSGNPAATEEAINRSAGYSAADTGLGQALSKRNFETRTLPDLVNRSAGRGAFFSSALQNQGGRAKEDYLGDQAQSTMQLQRALADLSRQRILAALGVAS